MFSPLATGSGSAIIGVHPQQEAEVILINGNPVESIAATDRGLAYGDGCFTTGRVRAGRLQLEQAHVDRLWLACERLFMTPPERELLLREIRQQAELVQEGVLKVLLTRGSGGRGYSAQGCHQTQRIIFTSAWPTHYASWQAHGIVLGDSSIALSCQPLLAGIKHLNRLEQVLIRREIDQQGWDEAAVLDTEGRLVECCAANLLWRCGDTVFTPRLERAGVSGIMRGAIMEYLASCGQTCLEVDDTRAALDEADEILLCNALLPVVPVRIYRQRELHDFTLCRQLQRFLDDSL